MKLELPGLLVEYLISGVVALIWIFPLLDGFQFGISIVYLTPAVYVVGMLVDIVAFGLTKIPKGMIRNRAAESRGYETWGSGTRRRVKIELHAPDLAQEMARRSSRDRIARGTIVNATFIAMFSPDISWGVSLVVIALSCWMWVFFEYSSATYVLEAEKAVDTRNQIRNSFMKP